MNEDLKDVKIHLVLGDAGIERIQVHSPREEQREAVSLTAQLTDIIDDFEARFLERISEWRANHEQA
jgi:hypothetical protein